MKYLFHIFISVCFLFLFYISSTFAAIDFYFSPIKYELSLATGSTITKPATLTNNGTTSVNIITSKSDFQSNGTSGTPDFVRKSELVYSDQEMSTWITIDTPSFTIEPGEDVTINFTIDVPENATPGGHYAAVFFKNADSENSTSGNIGINVDYGILILVDVEGEVIIDGGVSGSGVTIGSGGSAGPQTAGIFGSGSEIPGGEPGPLGIVLPGDTYDDCPLGDFTSSNFDGECFNIPLTSAPEEPGGEDVTDTNGEEEEFGVDFQVPFDNNGTVHIKPTGKITLKDSEGNELKKVGREVVINDFGAIVGENIVDYVPINDIGGNVLPKTTRVFESEWKGFPYETHTPEGELVIEYWTPGEYYTNKNKQEAGFLMFWERVCEAKKHKQITALIDMTYLDENGEEVVFSSAQEFDIEYTEQYIGKNPYVLLPLFIFALLLFGYCFWWFILAAKKKRRCKHCKTPVRKNWHVCPKCKKKIKEKD